jgi:hypothetical protein
MKCVILQPSYIPWRGYFDQIHRADVFVFYDDVQYDARGWRNRNRIKTSAGTRWLTIPVHAHGSQTESRAVNTIGIDWTRDWTEAHRRTLEQEYRKAPYSAQYAGLVEEIYGPKPEKLADFVIPSTIIIARELGITDTEFVRSSTLGAEGTKTDRLMHILAKLGATHYISGPSARSYLDEQKLSSAGITVEYVQYDYPEYPQRFPPFDPHVSILDLLFAVGAEAPRYIWGGG